MGTFSIFQARRRGKLKLKMGQKYYFEGQNYIYKKNVYLKFLERHFSVLHARRKYYFGGQNYKKCIF
jgi:hypothetical protein